MTKYVLVLFISFYSLFSGFAQSTEIFSNIDLNQNANYEDYRNFLIRIGFKDYCLEMQTSLSSADITDISKRVLEYNLDHYQIINIAREIAAFIFSYSQNNFSALEKQDHLIALSSFLLLPNKEIATDAIESYSKNNQITIEESFNQLTKNKMIQEKELLIAAITEVTDASDSRTIAQLDNYLSRYLVLKYTDSNLIQTNYLGRAIVAGFVRFARANQIEGVETKLATELHSHNIFLNNYISNKLSIINNKGQVQSVTLHAGDFANEYSKGSEAYYISIGTAPTGIGNRIKATSDHLLGNSFKFALYPTPDIETSILDKVSAKKNLSPLEKIQLSLIQTKPAIPGYSHAGIVDLKEDIDSGIKMSWIWDSYPNSDLGGIRFIGVEGFVFPGQFQKIGFIHYNSQKFLQYYQSQITSRGYLKNVWLSNGSKIEDDLIVPDNDQKKYAWPAFITENEFKNFAKIDNINAENWFKNDIAPRVTSTMEKYFTSTEAIAFANGFNNIRGAAYCSEAIVLAYLQGADIDPEVKQDRLSLIVHIGHALKLSELEDIDLTQRVISPAGFAWQTELVESHVPIMIEQAVDDNNTNKNAAVISNQFNDSTRKLITQFSLNKFPDLFLSELAY